MQKNGKQNAARKKTEPAAAKKRSNNNATAPTAAAKSSSSSSSTTRRTGPPPVVTPASAADEFEAADFSFDNESMAHGAHTPPGGIALNEGGNTPNETADNMQVELAPDNGTANNNIRADESPSSYDAIDRRLQDANGLHTWPELSPSQRQSVLALDFWTQEERTTGLNLWNFLMSAMEGTIEWPGTATQSWLIMPTLVALAAETDLFETAEIALLRRIMRSCLFFPAAQRFINLAVFSDDARWHYTNILRPYLDRPTQDFLSRIDGGVLSDFLHEFAAEILAYRSRGVAGVRCE